MGMEAKEVRMIWSYLEFQRCGIKNIRVDVAEN
jgi:hypothetical protein